MALCGRGLALSRAFQRVVSTLSRVHRADRQSCVSQTLPDGQSVIKQARAAVGETVILLTPPHRLYRNACQRERGLQQNDSLAAG